MHNLDSQKGDERIPGMTAGITGLLEQIQQNIHNLLDSTMCGLKYFLKYNNKKEGTFEIINNLINLEFLKTLYSQIYDLNINLFPNSLTTEIEYKNKGVIIEIKNDGLYINGKPIFQLVHSFIRLKQNDKLSSIFKIDIVNRWEIRWEIKLQILLDAENNYNSENIEDLLAELQNTLLPLKKVNFNKTHAIDNIYKPGERLYFDSEGIYTLINTEKIYFFGEISKMTRFL